MKPTGPGKNRNKRNADYFKHSSRTLNSKHRAVQQSRLKRQFQKSIRSVADDTPEYIKQILASDATDADETTLPRRNSQTTKSNDKDSEPTVRIARPDDKATASINEATAPTNTRPASTQLHHRNGVSTRGSNPYQRAVKKAQAEKLRKQEAYELKEKEFQETQAARKKYFKKRAKEHQVMSQKTKGGQLKLSSQVNLLLRKIQPK
ncbi:hypothetical protein H4R35_007392 [Dimargaris xerosporica]|nr:hypothetical protein H4R35_007392 [Dimargaris xerosporica]